MKSSSLMSPIRDLDEGLPVRVKAAARELASEYRPYSRYTEAALGDAFRPLLDRRMGTEPKGVDVGAGTGIPGQSLKVLLPSCRLWAVDSSPEMLERCATNGSYDRCIEAAANQLPIPSECMDFVISVHAVHLFEDKPVALKEMARVSKAGGIVLLITNVPSDLKTQLFHQLMPRFSELEIARHFDEDDVLHWSEQAGFRLLEVTKVGYCISFESQEELVSFLASRPFFGLRLLSEQEIATDLRHCEDKVETLKEDELQSHSALTTFVLERIDH